VGWGGDVGGVGVEGVGEERPARCRGLTRRGAWRGRRLKRGGGLEAREGQKVEV
jgi:hypothetical protein